jgi:NodT family efflux transporter outer membrane factor (OMF) lipoprotein
MKLNSKYRPINGKAALCILWAGSLFVALLFSSCDPAPKYAKPPAPTPTAFKEAPPEYKEGNGWKLAQPGDDKIRGKWWEIYNDPDLNALEEQVQISNQTIRAAEANFRSARALVVSARSNLFPTVTSSPSYSNSSSSQTSRVGTVTGSGGSAAGSVSGPRNIVNEFVLPVEATYTVDLWHRVRNTIAANAYLAEASAADVATAQLSTQAELASDYFQVRALDAQRRILDDTVASYRQSLELTRTLFNTGIDSDEDVAQAQTQLDTATAQATDLGVARAQFEHAIAILIGTPPANFSLPIAPFHPNPPEIPVAVPSALLERRPDIAAAERTIAAANAEIGVAKAAYYPNLSLSASTGFQTTSFTQWFNWPSRFWSVGPDLAQTIFSAGALRAATEQAQAQYDGSVANYRQTVLTAFQAVEDNLSSLRILSDESGQVRTAVGSASHFLDLALTRYKAGVDSYLNVITAQTTVLTNRETEVQVQLRQMTASVSLIMALGGGWDPAQIPQMKDLIVKPPKWAPAGPVQPAVSPVIAPANPPVSSPSGK